MENVHANLLIIFIAVTSLAVVIQMAILVALYVAVKKSSTRMEALAAEVQSRALPTLEAAQSMITQYRPKLDVIIENALTTTNTVKEQMKTFEPVAGDVVERTRQRVVEVDNLVGRILQRVDDASDTLHHSVTTPVRTASGVLAGLTTGLTTLFGRGNYARGKKATTASPKDDMFI